jgi:hypothetical protein
MGTLKYTDKKKNNNNEYCTRNAITACESVDPWYC